MAKIKFALLSVIGIIIFNDAIRAHLYIDAEVGGLTWMLFFILLFAFDIISIISIFISSKLIKQNDEEKLRKSARLVKLGSIFFFIAAFLYYDFKIKGFWEINIIVYFIALCTALLGTSVFSIAYIRLLYKEKKLCIGQAIIFTILQLIFVLDIIAALFLAHSKKNKEEIKSEKSKKSARELARFYLGSYTPPEFFTVIADAFKRGPVSGFFKRASAFFIDQWQSHRVRSGIIIAVLCLIPAGFSAYKRQLPRSGSRHYRRSRKPPHALGIFQGFCGNAGNEEPRSSCGPDNHQSAH